MSNIKYRIPKLSEFVQGFEFEVANDYSFMILDFDNPGTIKKGDNHRIWLPGKVWWKHNPDEIVNEILGDGTLTSTYGRVINMLKPFNEESYLKQGLIRVKIKDGRTDK